jgi:hypothetical protein
MNTAEIYKWCYDWIIAKEDNLPVYQDVDIQGGYANATDGYALARIPLSHINRDEWVQAHKKQHGLYNDYPDYRYPCGSKSITSKHERYGKFPDTRNIYLSAWDVLETVDMRCFVWDVHIARVQGVDHIEYLGLLLSLRQLDKLIHCPSFLRSNVESAITVTRKQSERFIRFVASDGIELYITPMNDFR